MVGEMCTRCGAHAEVMISRMEGNEPVSLLYCDACWRLARHDAGPVMTEGPITWGQTWPEVEAWLARNLRTTDERPNSRDWRRLLAHNLRVQLPHLRGEIPAAVSTFLRQFGDSAGQ